MIEDSEFDLHKLLICVCKRASSWPYIVHSLHFSTWWLTMGVILSLLCRRYPALYLKNNLSNYQESCRRWSTVLTYSEAGWIISLKLNKEKTCSLPIVTQLHWMAIVQQIHYNFFPSYLRGPLTKKTSVPQGALQIFSQSKSHHFNDKMLICPYTHTVRHADRSFKVTAPTLLNQPLEHLHLFGSVDTLKRHLKTYLYTDT